MARTRVISTRMRLAALVGGLALGTGAVVVVSTPANAHERELAKANLRLADGRFVGSAVFLGVNATVTKVRVNLDMPSDRPLPGFHGFHVHANNDPANGIGCVADNSQPPTTHFLSADGHLAEPGQTHGEHAGDLPPLLLTQKGRAYSVSITDRLHVDDVLGKAVLLHADPDNLGNVPTGTEPTRYTPNDEAATLLTENTGNAGARVACGVIGQG